MRTRARILEAAKQVFEEHGFLEARISDIAESAGLSHGSFYTYFESKEQIFREVAEAVDDQLAAPLGDVILAPSSSGIPPRARLREALRLHFESYRAEVRIMALIEQVARYDDDVKRLLLDRHRRYSAQVAESIRQLQRRGLADPTLDPPVVAAAIGALTGRFAELWLAQGAVDCSLEEGVEQMTTMLVNLLGIKDAPAKRRGAR